MLVLSRRSCFDSLGSHHLRRRFGSERLAKRQRHLMTFVSQSVLRSRGSVYSERIQTYSVFNVVILLEFPRASLERVRSRHIARRELTLIRRRGSRRWLRRERLSNPLRELNHPNPVV